MRKVVLLICAVAALLAAGCSDDDNGVRLSTVKVGVKLPDAYAGLSADSVSVVMKNTTTGVSYEGKTDENGMAEIIVEEGVYNVTAGVEKRSADNHGEVLTFQCTEAGRSITGVSFPLTLELQLTSLNKEWLIKEIYFSGSKTPANKNYLNDQYVVLYNNSDKPLYADGLSFCETYMMTSMVSTVNWDRFLPGRVAAGTIYTVPGSGKEHLVQPGEEIVLAGLGVDHTGLGTAGVNMSKADFEWYDGEKDTDVPEVPNLVKNFSYSATVWVMNSQGTKSYFIFKLDEGMSMTSFLEENYVEGINSGTGKAIPAYAIPVQYIYDGVEVSQKDALAVHALPSAVDAGYTFGSGIGSGKALRRKTASNKDGRAVLQDTNNSTNDFETGMTPSYGASGM